MCNSSGGLSTRVLWTYKTIPAITVELRTAAAAVALRHLPWVDYVAESTQLLTPDVVLVNCFDPATGASPPRGSAGSPQEITWNISQVGANLAWNLSTGTNPQNQELSIMDDGADEQQANIPLGTELANATVYAWYVAASVRDGYHGTSVLGAASALNNGVGVVGVAFGSTTRVLKIYDDLQPNWDYWTQFAIDGNSEFSRVMSISYSTKVTDPSPPQGFVTMYDAIKRGYYNWGTIFVASTGNQSRSDLYAFPAAFPEVVGVGGSGFSDEFIYNNYAPGNVEVSAPATQVGTVCKGGQTGTADGTSFGTPMVAGAFMLLKDRFPGESPQQLRTRLTSTAVPMANSQQSGAGRMDIYAAIIQ